MKKIKSVLYLSGFLICVSLLGLASCKKPVQAGGELKTFDVAYIKVWESTVKKNVVEVKGGSQHNVQLKVKNCNDFTMTLQGESDIVEASVNEGVGVVDSFAIKRGSSTLTITLKATGFTDAVFPITVTRKDSKKALGFTLRKQEDGRSIEIFDKMKVETSSDNARVTVKSDTPMLKVVSGGKKATLQNENKLAVIDVDSSADANATIKVLATFENYADSEIEFKLIKVPSGQVSISPISARLYSGDVDDQEVRITNTVTFDDNREFSIELDNIEYSLLKLEMDVDTDLLLAKVTCDDGRSANYLTDPIEEDLLGKYAGTLAGEIDEETRDPKGFDNIDPTDKSKYREYLIVGAGTVKYEIQFIPKDKSRKTTTYKLTITNKNTEKYRYKEKSVGGKLEPAYPVLLSFDYELDQGIPSNLFPCLPFTCYHEGPYCEREEGKAGYKLVDKNFDKLEFAGNDVAMWFWKQDENVDELKKTGKMVLYYNIYYNTNEHSFIRSKVGKTGVSEKTGQPWQMLALVAKGLHNKRIDAFLGFKKWLPLGTHPYSIKNRWKRVANKMLMLKMSTVEKDGDKLKLKNNDVANEIYDYRRHVKYFEKAERNPTTHEEVFEIAKNLSWTDWGFGVSRSTKASKEGEPSRVVLTGDDILRLLPTFIREPADVKNTGVKYTIKKGTKKKTKEDSSDDLQPIPDQKDVESRIVVIDNIPYIVIGVKKEENPNWLKDEVFHFTENGGGNEAVIYEVELTITHKGEVNKYIYRLDYKNDVALTLEDMPRYHSSSEDLFGIPTTYGKNDVVESVIKEIKSRENLYSLNALH